MAMIPWKTEWSQLPTAETWDHITAAMDQASNDEEFWVSATSRFATWPPEVPRPVPMRWLFHDEGDDAQASKLRNKPWPRGMALASHLIFSSATRHRLSSKEGAVLQILLAPELDQLCYIDFGYASATVRQFSALAKLPRRASLETLVWRYGFNNRKVARLAACRCFTALTTLDLCGNSIGVDGVAAILGSATFEQLEVLKLAENPLGDEGVALLCESTCLSGDLTRTGLSDDGVRRLASAPQLSRIKELSLSDNKIESKGACHLALSPFVEELEYLNLGRCRIGPEGLAAIATSPTLSRLKEINLAHSGGDSASLELLSRASWFEQLEVLDLSYCNVDDRGLRAMTQATMPRLKVCNLMGGHFSAKALQVFLDVCPQLEELNLHTNEQLGTAGAKAIANWPGSSRLTSLNLQSCQIKREGAIALAASPHLTGLKELLIWSGDIGNGGEALRASDNFRKTSIIG